VIDFLLVNPGEHANDVVHALRQYNLSHLIISTNGYVFPYTNLDLNVLDLNSNPWNRNDKFMSSMAWTRHGKNFIDGIEHYDQIVMSNPPLRTRKDSRLTFEFTKDKGRMFDVVSYKGRHVVTDASVYIDSKWSVLHNFELPFFKNGVAGTFKFLNNLQIVNGLNRVFVDVDGNRYLGTTINKLMSTTSRRNFIDIWPKLVSLEATNSALAKEEFSNWVSTSGKSDTEFYSA